MHAHTAKWNETNVFAGTYFVVDFTAIDSD